MKKVTSRYRQLKHGIYFDTETKLLWHPEQTELNHSNAMNHSESLDTARIKWRVPTRRELLMIVDDSLCVPATGLPGMECNNYWSSSTSESYTAYVWIVSFLDGYSYISSRTNSYNVRCVAGPVDDSVIRELELKNV
jgi:hypothetical protein